MEVHIPTITLGTDVIVSLSSILLSLTLTYFWGIRAWYASLPSEKKPAVMGIAITLICLGIAGFSWTNVWVLVPATPVGALFLFIIWVQALVANQTTYSFTKKNIPADVKLLKAARPQEAKIRY